MTKAEKFRELIQGKQLIVAPGATTALFARLVENAGFPVVYITGAGLANTNFCVPDFNLISMSENLEIARRINYAVSIPCIADIDDGYGGPLNVRRTVREYADAGIAAVQLEDQRAPKRCGHFDNQVIIPCGEMVGKIKAAKDAAPELVLIARTDAISATGNFEEALERAVRYAEAGADMLFVEAPGTKEQVAAIPAHVSVPVVLNIVEDGKTPALPNNEIHALGYKLVLYANAPMKAGILGTQRLLDYLAENGTTEGASNELMISSRERHEILEKDHYEELMKQYE